MTSVERVQRAVEFRTPDRVPIENLCGPDQSDIVMIGATPAFWEWQSAGNSVEECVDDLGCIRRRSEGDGTIGQIIGHPIDTWDKASEYRIHSVPDYYDRVMSQLESVPEDKYIYGDLGNALFCITSLRGLVNFFEDIYLHRSALEDLIDEITDFRASQIEMYAKTRRVHCVAMYDDWAMQTGLMIDPSIWTELFQPAYSSICTVAREYGMHSYIHMCGNPFAITGELIEAGFDILNYEQVKLMSIEHLGNLYAGKITFCLPVDAQSASTKCDEKRFQQEIQLLSQAYKLLGSRDGGFIVKNQGPWSVEQNFDYNECLERAFCAKQH